jgi:hypothetical protein
MAWLHDREHGAFDLIQAHLNSWLAENPPRIGVNWASSLEVAYRAIAWCWLLWLLRGAPWRESLISRVAAALEVHALHVERYLSTYFSPNTHLTGEALGLFYVGTVMQDSPHAARWRRLGSDILEQNVDRQILSDGVYFERAMLYHRYAVEIYLHYLLLARDTNWALGPAVRPALHRAFDVLRSVTSASGTVPLIGDDDGGCLLPLDRSPPHDVRGLLFAGACALDRPDLVVDQSPSFAMAYWLCGEEAVNAMRVRMPVPPVWRDQHFAAGGLCVLRDRWDAAATLAVIDVGAHGVLNCGHAHADALSITLDVRGTPLLIDRGTLTYVGPERNEFRSTASHNTLELDAQSSVQPATPFRWGAVPPPPRAILLSSPGLSALRAVAFGHAHSERPSSHERCVVRMHDQTLLVFDKGQRSACSGGKTRWQLHPGLRTTIDVDDLVRVSDGRGQTVASLLAASGGAWTAEKREYSPRFGARCDARVLVLPVDRRLHTAVAILPAPYPDDLLRSTAWNKEGFQEFSWSSPTATHQLLVSSCPRECVSAQGWRIDADVVWYCGELESARPNHDLSAVLIALNVRAIGPAAEAKHCGFEPLPGPMVTMQRTESGWQALVMDELCRV